MTPVELFSVSLSVVSLLTSGAVAFFAYRLSALQLRVNVRNEFGKLLTEINKEVLRDPILGYYRDSKRPPGLPPLDHLQQIKLGAMGYMILNAGEVLFDYYVDGRSLTRVEAVEWADWKGLFSNLMNDSSTLRGMILRPEVRAVYSAGFIQLLEKWVAEGATERAKSASDPSSLGIR